MHPFIRAVHVHTAKRMSALCGLCALCVCVVCNVCVRARECVCVRVCVTPELWAILPAVFPYIRSGTMKQSSRDTFQVIKLQDLRDRMGWLQSRFGEPKSRSPSIGQASNGDQSPTNDQDSNLTDCSAASDLSSADDGQPKTSNGVCKGQMDSDGVQESRNVDRPKRKTSKNGAADDLGQTGKNKNLESTIMRILQDKREAEEQNEKGDTFVEEGDSIADYYRELNREIELPVIRGNYGNDQQRAPSSNKRKGAPPRKCLVPSEKKMALDGIKTEVSDTYIEESDMEEYA